MPYAEHGRGHPRIDLFGVGGGLFFHANFFSDTMPIM